MKKNESEKVKLGSLVLKNWWKVILILLVIGLAFSGFRVQCGEDVFVKQSIKLKQVK